jgi:small-conductance mechanosensitive channel
MATVITETDWLAQLLAREADDLVVVGIRAALTLLIGLVLARALAGLAARIAGRRGTAQAQMITRRLVFYAVVGLTVAMTLDTVGVKLGVLLGAAGILTVAIGFAAQTSASNLISGVFLLGERPFSVGDSIEVGGTEGEVLAVDLLSVKLRTYNNLYVRVPNESLIKSQITNLSRNPIRRIEVELRVAYSEDLDRLRALLFSLADKNPDILEEPVPLVWVDRLGESAIHIRFLVWAANRAGFFDVRSRVLETVARGLVQHRVAIGYAKVGVDEVDGASPSPSPTDAAAAAAAAVAVATRKSPP